MSLSAFLAENAVPVENIKFVASKRFLGEDGNPIPWEIKTITGTEDEALRKSCAKRVPVPGKKNQYQKETDYDLYLGKLAVACTVFPNLNDKELQSLVLQVLRISLSQRFRCRPYLSELKGR